MHKMTKKRAQSRFERRLQQLINGEKTFNVVIYYKPIGNRSKVEIYETPVIGNTYFLVGGYNGRSAAGFSKIVPKFLKHTLKDPGRVCVRLNFELGKMKGGVVILSPTRPGGWAHVLKFDVL
jgi:hypothetical protein